MAFAATFASLAISAGSAFACSPPPGVVYRAFQDAEDQRYLERVTTIYTGVLEHMVGEQDDPLVTFTIRKTGDVWGYPGPAAQALSYVNGACQRYLPFTLDGEGSARNGLAVTVFVTPEARNQPDKLYIFPTSSLSDAMMMRWRQTLPRRFGH